MKKYFLLFIIVLLSTRMYASIPQIVLETLDEEKMQIKPELVLSIIGMESDFNPNLMGDGGRSHGLMQIQLGSAKVVGFNGKRKLLLNPEVNIKYGIKFFKYLYEQTGDIYKALDAYNRGLGNVTKHPFKGKWKNHRYVGKILKYMETEYDESL